MHVIKHFATVFPGLPLDPPLFYSWPIALRFELNVRGGSPPDHEEVTARAATLYESAFSPTDVAYIISVAGHFPGGTRPSNTRRNFFRHARRLGLGIPRPSGVVKIRHTRQEVEDWGATRTTIRWAENSPRRIAYRFILHTISFEDFPIGGRLDGDLFFYNKTRGILLHMYDDCGLDLIASTRSALQPIHDAHNDWLLDYDRVTMARTFSGHDSGASAKEAAP